MSGVDGMERVFYDLHRRVSLLALRRTSHRTRTVIEHTALVCGVCAFCIVLLCHRTFVYRGPTNTGSIGGGTGGVGGLGGAVLDGLLNRRGRKADGGGILGTKGGTLPAACLRGVPGFDADFDVLQIAIGDEDLAQSYAYTLQQDLTYLAGSTDDACNSDADTDANETCSLFQDGKDPFEPLYSYSKTKGLLLLPVSVQMKHNISVHRVVVSRVDEGCFGEEFLRNLVFGVVGPSTVALNWLLALNNGTGYILPSSGQIVDLPRYASDFYFLLPRPWEGAATKAEDATLSDEGKSGDRTQQRRGRSFLLFKLGVFGASVFLFFVTTTLVAFTLNETQERMLNFTFHLQEQVRHRLPIGRLIVSHIVENLVFVPIMLGTIFFLIEFYGGDKFLAFMVLTIVWVSEVFSVISMRTHQGIIFFPRVFFLYFTLFHAYYFSCPFGFSYTSLLSSVLFLIHSMLFFWNRYELPAILSESVSADSPRQRREAERPAEGTTGIIPPPINTILAPGNTSGPLLPRPLTRGQNHPSITSMSSLGRGSVAGGSNFLFQEGGNHEGDDGDDSSYMFFMNGEVVMHRERHAPARSRSPSITSAGEGEPEYTPEIAPPVPAAPQTPRTRNGRPEPSAADTSTAAGAAPMRLFPFPFWDRSVRQRRVQPPGNPDQES